MVTTTRSVIASDGVRLAVYESRPAGAPVIVCVHGYPDNASVWDAVRAELSGRYRVVTYDVRGTGRSGEPRSRDGYRLEQLVADLATVIDAVSPERPVHLLAHDWGSIQCWHAVTGDQLAHRIASFTSISGPDLAHSRAWLRSRTSPRRDVARQSLHSSYILLFCLPGLPELLWRSGLMDRLLGGWSRRPPARPLRDEVNGLQLYRANMLRSWHPRPTSVPVQVIAPTRDRYVSVALQSGAPARWTRDLRVVRIDAGHWVVRSRPREVAGYVSGMVDQHC